MNRLQKKCVIGTAAIHLLLLTILIVGPAFFNPTPKSENQILTMISANVVDNALSQGARDAQRAQAAPAPAPTPIPQQLLQGPPPIPTPAPQKAVEPPALVPMPAPSFLTRMEHYFHTPAKADPTVTPNLTRAERTEKSQTDANIKVSLAKIKRSAVKNDSRAQTADNTRAISSTLRSLKSSLSSSTRIDMPGNADASYANYGDVVISVYYSHWLPPSGMARDNVTVKFKVTISRDGTVIAAHITEPSGDPNVDAAVQRMLDSVTFIQPFPAGTDDKERVYPINFNATRTSE